MPEINSVAGQLVGIPMGQVYTAGPGINIDNVNKVVSVDETVLWDANGQVVLSGLITMSEPITNFERYKVYITERERGTPCVCEFHTLSLADSSDNKTNQWNRIALVMFQTTNREFFTIDSNYADWNTNDFTQLTIGTQGYVKYMAWGTNTWSQWTEKAPGIRVLRVVGINRISA